MENARLLEKKIKLKDIPYIQKIVGIQEERIKCWKEEFHM